MGVQRGQRARFDGNQYTYRVIQYSFMMVDEIRVIHISGVSIVGESVFYKVSNADEF